MSDDRTLAGVLARGAAAAPALAAPGQPALDYGSLRQQADDHARALAAAGLGRTSRIALVLGSGPLLALALLATMRTGAAAPLNPAYTREEFDFYLADLDAAALIVEAGSRSPAAASARARGVAVHEIAPLAGASAGCFELMATRAEAAEPLRSPRATDPALYLHTSGTTAKPKLVPLSHGNLAASAGHTATTLELTAADSCLNVMPLFHIHGIAALLASLASGGRVICTPGFNGFKFFSWIEETKPSWYTAVPSMHQMILARAAHNRALGRNAGLRFVRSSSAALPAATLADLEALFGSPVIEAYGMTEAAHQMASNPLPPRARKTGTVGPAAGPEIAILDEGGRALGPGAVGEVAIRGPNVMAGYDRNPEANAQAFVGGWLRTGDLGRLDGDGYLTLTGRIKEIINRGGEKIAPREIDEALSAHPAVAQAVAFAVPHPVLGQDVAAAVVLRAGQAIEPAALRAYLAQRLAAFKVPRTLVILDAIPAGATGKPQRRRLAELLARELERAP